MQTRRHFLTSASVFAAGVGLGVSPVRALTRRDLMQPVTAWMPPPVDDDYLKDLAQVAMNEASRLGATFADIRVEESQLFMVGLGVSGTWPGTWISASRCYGMRVLVNGVWGFVAGVLLEKEALARAAAKAVANAKYYGDSLGISSPVQYVPMTPVQGEWRTTAEIDPFTVPLRLHTEQLGAINGAIDRVLGINIYESRSSVSWGRKSVVFASTEGSLLAQHVVRATPSVSVMGQEGEFRWSLPNYGLASGGFETLLDAGVVDRVKAFCDEVVWLESLPEVEVDVGRYTIVMGGSATARHAHRLAQACEADRASGAEADAAGSTFLSPMPDILGARGPQFSPMVDLNVSASETSAASWKWDCEGVLLKGYPLIRAGKVVNFTSSRDNPVDEGLHDGAVLQGGSVAMSSDRMPMVGAAEVTMAAEENRAPLETLIGDVDDGLYLTDDLRVSTDPTLATSISESNHMFRVKKGKLVGRVMGIGLLHGTAKMWKDGLVRLGDASTLHVTECTSLKGMPWNIYRPIVTAPAAVFRDVDAIRTAGAPGSLI